MLKRLLIFIIILAGLGIDLNSQHEPQQYIPETDPLVLKKLEKWQDLKFGLLMHWGPYCQWGIVESWSLCSEDEGWTRRTKGRNENYGQYKLDYENLKTTFNPVRFDPDKWAAAAKTAGMKYVVFTTKHHDGFCMFDSKYTDYKITDAECPFSSHPKANVTKEIFDAFRKQGFWVGAYFSKPDWHSPYYWWPYFATPDRNPNYRIEKYPQRWEKFVQFTHNQIDELMTGYGKIDILWLDGGWVQPYTSQQLSAYRSRKDFKQVNLQSQDIRMSEIVSHARVKQPGLIVVDRAVAGPYQNYLTPENRIPEKLLPYPWESCIIMGGGWSYSFNPKFKSSRELIHILVDIVSKGGNLLLNIGPSPEGTWYPEAYTRLEDIGKWMSVNSTALYGSRPLAPYKEGKICFTQQKDGSLYAIYLGSDKEPSPPAQIRISSFAPADDAEILMLGTAETLSWKREGNGFTVEIPERIQKNPPCHYAWTFKIKESKSSQKNIPIKFASHSFQMAIDHLGQITNLIDKSTGDDYFAKSISAPFLSIRVNQEIIPPSSADFDEKNQILLLRFDNNIHAKIRVESKATYLTFELQEISGSADIELIVWGPYPTTIKTIIGETIGVVRGERFSLGIQALNIKTLGGYPWNENDHLPQTDIFDSGENFNLAQGRKGVLYSVEAAKPTPYGSTLQAYCRNRNKDRIIKNWGQERFLAPAYADGGVTGSKIALFGCPVVKTLETIGAIELAEGLPHPQLDGQWGKTAPSASAAYIILNFSEKDMAQALEITKKAGLRYLYHSDPFSTWGHFQLKKQYFPHGIKSLKNCVEKAEAMGIMLGLHTLSNFITTNDPYVTPLPDPRLARIGSSILSRDIDARQSDIFIDSPDFFNQFERNILKTVMIGQELIRYGGISTEPPWKLWECQRGAFGTKASPHAQGEEISKLADHAYKVFLTNSELSVEVAKTIADIFNQTGVRQISFDGLEGNHSTGMGNLGEVLFTKTWYDHLDEKIKKHYIADASRSGHFFWHIYTRMNWGEPWYAGFRESQTEYRLRNQKYFQRNFMPGMLGWFKMTSQTSIEDIEWMLARSAGFDAGYAFVSDYTTLETNGHSQQILTLLGEWEQARMSGAFSSEQKQLMQDIQNEFQLESPSDRKWELFRVYSYKFKHAKQDRQPGEPPHSHFSFENPAALQPMNFILTADGGYLSEVRFEIDNFKTVVLPVTLEPGHTLKYQGGNKAVIYSQTWQKLKEMEIDVKALTLSPGPHSLAFDCRFARGDTPQAKLELRFSENLGILSPPPQDKQD